MSQLTLYLETEVAARVKEAASSAGMSQSQWVTRLIRQHVSQEWPESVKSLAGAWQDLPTAAQIRRSAGEDAERESL